jgi:mono/diheme cytochrome c family protein
MKRTIALISAPLCLAVALGSITPAGARRPRHGGLASAASGQQVYMRNCARCHGANAQGKIGPRLAGTSLSVGTIENTVTNGGSKMPSFKKQLSPAQVKAVAAYVRSLGGSS